MLPLSRADYVVVGSGPAGCAFAASVAAASLGSATVIVLERGRPADATLSGRAFFPSCLAEAHSERSGYDATPALFKKCASSGQGRVVGGGSAINAGALIDEPSYWEGPWSRDAPVGKWGREAMESCAREVESKLLGSSQARWELDAGAAHFLEATQALGFHPRSDAAVSRLDEEQQRVAFVPRNVLTADGPRPTAASLLSHRNIRLVPGANALRIIWSGRRAVGVQLQDGTRVDAGVALVVAGGSLGTAELLLRSGVGCPTTTSARIVVDSPSVGRELRDHPTVAVPLIDLRGGTLSGCEIVVCLLVSALSVALALVLVLAFVLFRLRPRTREGASADPPGYRATAFDREFQLSYFPSQTIQSTASLLSKAAALPWYSRCALAVLARAAFVLGWSGGREPVSLGAVLATVSAPTTSSNVRLDPTLKADAPPLAQGDVVTLKRAVAAAEEIAAALSRRRMPAPTVSEAAMETAARLLLRLLGVYGCKELLVGTLYHPVGGAARGTVLDADLLVRGADALYVVGAAAMPRPPRANPMATCYAMGWRLGEILAASNKR